MDENTDALTVSLPGVVEDKLARIDLGSYAGEAIVALALYPSNAGPEVKESAALLEACERLASDSDVIAFGVAPESVYSHRQFARRANLSLPLLSDTACHVAREYDVVEQRSAGVEVPTRSLFVFDYRGGIVHRWTADDGDRPDVDDIREQLADVTPKKSARGCYRVAHAHYTEGRRRLSRGLAECGEENWPIAQTEFEDACGEFAESTDLFMKGQGLAQDAEVTALNDRARERATSLWEAAEWLAGFAMAAEKDDTEKKEHHRQEAGRILDEISEAEPLPEPGDDAEDDTVPRAAL